MYLQEIEQLEPVTAREQVQIMIQAFGNDVYAKEKLVRIFLPRVIELI